MIYIKEDDGYSKYHTNQDNKFICTVKGKSESVILHEVSGEFDGIITPNKNVHFVLQGLDGELIYLKKEADTWKKYCLLKSRKAVQKISAIRLVCSKSEFCVFYVIGHQGKNLLVKHVFSLEDMAKEPEILGIIDVKRDYVLTDNNQGNITVIFKTVEGKYRKLVFDLEFKIIKDEFVDFENNILELSAICHGTQTYYAYSVPRKNSVAIIFCKEDNLSDEKVVTFGIARNSPVHILYVQNHIVIQWEENGMIMESQSNDFGKTFSKPKHLSSECKFAKIRQIQPCNDLAGNKCAVYNMAPFTAVKKGDSKSDGKGVTSKVNNYSHINKEINGNVTNEELLKNLNEIKGHIDKMEKSLIGICSFLEDLKTFKHNSENANVFAQSKAATNLTGQDIGEIDNDNVKLFESTDIDDIMPDKAEI